MHLTHHQCVQLVQPSFSHFFESQVGQKYNYPEFHPKVVKDTKKNPPRWQTMHEEEEVRDQSFPDPNLGGFSENKSGTGNRLTNISGKENLKEGGNKIINPLHISTCWMPYGPYVENTF